MAENGTKRDLSDDENENGDEKVAKRAKVTKTVKEAGTLLFSGLSDYTQRNSPTLNKSDDIKWTAQRFQALDGIKIREVSSHGVAYFFLAITDEGAVYSWGFNACGQLGMGDNFHRKNPTLMESMSGHNVVAVATGRQHGLILTDAGDVYAVGDNKTGQCGIGAKKEKTSTPVKIEMSEGIKHIACGEEFSLLLGESGKLYSCGSPENGHLGHGSEGREIKGRKEVFHYVYTPEEITSFIEIDDGEVVSHGQPTIVYMDAGINHSCAIDDQQRLFSWGFGGYGRLGHNSTQNELRPRLLKCWYKHTGRADGGVTRVWCGGQFNIVDTIVEKCKYTFGQFTRSCEANMYPKFMEDLQGWNCRHVVCGQYGFTICADDSVIGSQPSPGYGTLAMGEKKKSSAPPMLLTTLKDVYVLRSGLGYMHACFIARDSSEKDRAAIEKFPFMEFEEVLEEEEEEVDTKKKFGKGKGAGAAAKVQNNGKTAKTKTTKKKK